MKKNLIILFIAGLLTACTYMTEKDTMDTTAGASLNAEDTIAQYDALKEKIDIVANNPAATPEEFAELDKEVKAFQSYINKYRATASPAASSYIDAINSDFYYNFYRGERGGRD